MALQHHELAPVPSLGQRLEGPLRLVGPVAHRVAGHDLAQSQVLDMALHHAAGGGGDHGGDARVGNGPE
eukprot:8291223-Alexandrium_andersonii.AAC.1